jgi:hypothetical protein
MFSDHLYLKKEFKAARASSFDRSGRNDDALTVPAGHKTSFANIAGPGIIKHIWMTTYKQKEVLDGLVLRIYWDGADFPSVETPIGSFFGLGFGYFATLKSAPVVVSPGLGMNCYFPMPFRKAAVFEIENQTGEDRSIFFHIDYEFGLQPDDNACYFHALWRAEKSKPLREADPISANYDANNNFHDIITNVTGTENYNILKVEGQGHYVGCFMHVFSFLPCINNFRCWYGEGDDMIFVDGELWPPSIHGTGEEDYFNDAFGLHEFQSPYFGCHFIDALKHEAVGRYSSYRFHIPDPIPFQREINVTIEHGHGNERGDFRQSMAFYYLTEPGRSERLPAYADRELMNDFQIFPKKVDIPRRKGPYDTTFPGGEFRRNT